MTWIHPVSHSDPAGTWTNPTNAYDNNIATAATTYEQNYLILVPSYPIACDKVRVYCEANRMVGGFFANVNANIDVDVYYSGGWHTIHSGVLPKWVWNEINIGTTELVSQIRIKSNLAFYANPLNYREHYLEEVEFWNIHSSFADTNILIRTYLQTASALTNPLIALISDRIYCPRLPENTTLPAISFFTRGGFANRFRKSAVSPSIQFDCWADNPIDAREVYRALYDALHSIGNADITIAGTIYYIIEAREEVQGQDLVDIEIPNYFRVLTFYQITIRDDL